MAKRTEEKQQQLDTWWDSLSDNEKRLFQIIRRATFQGMNDYHIQNEAMQRDYIPEIIPHKEA